MDTTTSIHNGSLPLSLLNLEKTWWAEQKPEVFRGVVPSTEPNISEVEKKPSSPGGGSTRKRASRTCAECHRRKIRCNIEFCGGPCQKCQLSETKCVPFIGGRKRALQQRVKLAIEKACLGSKTDTRRSPASLPAVLSDNDTTSSSPSSVASSAIFTDHKPSSDTTDVTHTSLYETTDFDTAYSPFEPPQSCFYSSSNLPVTPVATLGMEFPDIFEPFPIYLDATDLEYLRSRQALSIPSESLQQHLLLTYIRFVHKNLPILDLRRFSGLLGGDSPSKCSETGKGVERIPLLLFQAVMFAAAGYVDVDILKSCGYQDRRTAQERFYKAVRALYDLNTCNDRLHTIQSLLLLALGSFGCDFELSSGRDAWYWLDIATSLTYSLGLNIEEPAQDFPTHGRRLRRRTWWGVVVLDCLLRLCPEGTARSHRITIQESQVDMLTLDDFDLQPPYHDGSEDFDEIQMSEDALNFIDAALICRFGSDLALYKYPSELSAAKDAQLSVFLRDVAVEEHNSTRVASYTFPVSSEGAGIIVLSAIV